MIWCCGCCNGYPCARCIMSCLHLFSEARSNNGEDGWTNCLPNAHRLPFKEFCSVKGLFKEGLKPSHSHMSQAFWSDPPINGQIPSRCQLVTANLTSGVIWLRFSEQVCLLVLRPIGSDAAQIAAVIRDTCAQSATVGTVLAEAPSRLRAV